ncbi:Flagellum-specific ATP synthase [compost metagenome]
MLSRTLAEAGHYPAIDIEASISRAMTSLIAAAQFDTVRRFKQMLSRYQRNRDLISVGAYAPGHDLQLDQAIAMYPRIEAFLQQSMHERTGYEEAIAHMDSLFTNTPSPGRP